MSTDAHATAHELGLMEGFPPPPDKRVNRSNALMTPPFNRWSYQHMRTIYPSAPIRSADTAVPLPVSFDDSIDGLTVKGPQGDIIGFSEYLRTTYTDALVIVTPEGIVYEAYLNGMGPDQPHQMMSVTKSFAGLFGLMAIAEGRLSESDPVTDLVPELSTASAFHRCHVRARARHGQLHGVLRGLRRSGLRDRAVRSDPRLAAGTRRRPSGRQPLRLPGHVARAPRSRPRRRVPLPDTEDRCRQLGDQPGNREVVPGNMAGALWSKLGTDGETYVLLDRNGTLVAGGGLNAGPHNLARFAVMLLNDGSFAGRQVVDPQVIEWITAGASREAFSAGPDATGAFGGGDWSYRAQWWVRHTPGREAFTGSGIHGQWIYIDHSRRVGIVKQASQPVSLDEQLDQVNMDMFDSIIGQLAH